MFQFADITQPRLGFQLFLGVVGKGHGLFTVDIGIFRDEYLGKRYDILRPLPQGRDLYVYRIDTIQQVLAELLFLYHLLQVPVRGADQADIDGDRGIATYPYDAPALQGGQ